jgi:hypothetical protein
MSDLIGAFKDCAHLAGEVCNCRMGKLIRSFGLGDFLDNKLTDDDDAATIAVKALDFFCDEGDPHAEKFKFAVLTVGIFLNHHLANRDRSVPQQALRDLVSILRKSHDESQIRRWIESNF